MDNENQKDEIGPNAKLFGADLSWAELPDADLSGADLREANLVGVNLTGADLQKAQLSNSNLRKARLGQADLIGANLIGADLRKAYLKGANLKWANLTDAKLTDIRYDSTTIWPAFFDPVAAGAGQPEAGTGAQPVPFTIERPRGIAANLNVALRIAAGGLALLLRHPVLVLPLVPLFLLVFAAVIALPFIESLFWGLAVVFAVAFALMFSFAVSSQMLHQIDAGHRPNIITAITAPGLMRMIPRVFILSAVWYFLVMLLVIVETVLRALISRLSKDLADSVVDFIFGTIADALRMAGFMLVAIMTFEDVGLVSATTRMRQVLKASPISALGGLALTKMTSALAIVVLWVIPDSMRLLSFVALGALWIFSMYVEQIFVTGLYRYAVAPDSALVRLLLGKFMGHELPEVRLPQFV